MTIDQTIELWFHYEEIAMHFNELIIQYRLQLMGGIGSIGALSGYFIGSKVEEITMRHKLRAFIATGILLLLWAAWNLDINYYNQLLRGAVDALIQLEKEHPEINMSTAIKARFTNSATTTICRTYLIVGIPLFLFTIWSWYVLWKESKKQDSPENF